MFKLVNNLLLSLALWSYGVQFINKEIMAGGIFFPQFFQGFPEVVLRLPCHLAHNFWPIDEKEECSRFIDHNP